MAPWGDDTDTSLLRFTTAGSVDDGKSSLIGRLLYDANAVPSDRIAALDRIARRRGESEIDLSLLMDGLVAEREQGITIDVAYNYFSTPRRKFIIADTPGHEEYTRNMVTGASTADAAVILVDARRGPTEQTRRHLYLSHLLGVPHLIVAVNKMDLVEFDERAHARIASSLQDLAARMGVAPLHLVPISAKYGDNVVHRSSRMAWYAGKPLLALLETLPAAIHARDAPFRFPVQYVRRVATPAGGQSRHYLGRIESGRVRVGDEIAVMPSGSITRVRAISTFDGSLTFAVAPKSVAIEVEHDLDIARGDVLAPVLQRPRVARRLDATICWFSDEAFTGAGRYLLKCGTRLVAARLAQIRSRLDIATLAAEPDPSTLARNDIALVAVELAAPLAFDGYEDNRATGAFILIDADTNATVAAGMIRREDGDTASAQAAFDPGI